MQGRGLCGGLIRAGLKGFKVIISWRLPAGAAQPGCRGGAAGGHCAGIAAEALQGSVSSCFQNDRPISDPTAVRGSICVDSNMLSSSQTLSAELKAPSRANAAGSLQKTGGSVAGAAQPEHPDPPHIGLQPSKGGGAGGPVNELLWEEQPAAVGRVRPLPSLRCCPCFSRVLINS